MCELIISTMKTFFVVLIFATGLLAKKYEKHWGYEDYKHTYGPSEWSAHNKECGLKRQSPVLLKCDKKSKMGPVHFYMYGKPSPSRLTNNGHTLRAIVSTDASRPLRMRGGPLVGEYVVEQFHFHWGSNGSVKKGQGSEHRLTKTKTIAELHIVTYKQKYGSFQKALSHPDGLAVLGILFKEGGIPMREPVNLAKRVGKLIKFGSSIDIPAKENMVYDLMKTVFLSRTGRSFYTYSGSLTTPPCSQIVRWIVSRKVIGLPKGLLGAMQKMQDENSKPIVDNFRPLQALNNRKITCN